MLLKKGHRQENARLCAKRKLTLNQCVEKRNINSKKLVGGVNNIDWYLNTHCKGYPF